VNLPYIAVNLLKNAIAPVVIPLRRSRGVLGMDGDASAVVRALEFMAPALEAGQTPIANARVLELGPGRSPETSAGFVLAGARSAIGLDVALQVPEDAGSASRYGQLAHLLATSPGRFLASANTSPARVAARYEELSGGPWPVQFRRYEGAAIPLPDRSVDVIVSKSVLEHVPAGELPRLVEEMRRVLAPGGCMVHVVDLRDHMHILQEEVSGNWLQALEYPEWLFRVMFANRSTTINRLRSPEWRRLLDDAGLAVVGWTERRYPLPPGFDRRRLREPWSGYDDETLRVGWICFAARG
jgi:SAM-dependent methyltransferase